MEFKYEDFKVFVKGQPRDKVINHNTRQGNGFVGWCGCAVGEYIQTRMGKPIGVYDFVVQHEAKMFMLNIVGSGVPTKLELNLRFSEEAQDLFPNYGALSDFLEKI